ncbi:MAG: hypothetical protein KDD55_10770, partial [Bdellovibrionales bacterium]|nr:hypothetical protein [Bdellovibrionales bacterium]
MDSSQCLGDRFRGFPSYILLASCVTLLAFYASQPGSLDDTFILLVYVRHFVESSQLYYNVSDGAVDGFTSVLDLILKSSVFSLFGGDLLLLNWIVTVSCMLGASAVGASLLLILRSSFSCYVSLPFMIVAISTLSLNPGLAEGATFLLEVPLFLVLFLTLLLLCITQKELPVVFGSLLFLLFLARPEGLVYGGVLLLYCRLLSFSRKFFITSSSIFIALSVGYLFWHFSYFGHVAPNTYYAKTSSCFSCELNDGFVNASRFVFLLGGGGIGGAVLALPLFSYFILQSHRRAYWGLWLLLVASFGIVIVEGGDSYQLTRFFAPAYAVGVIAVCFGYFASISSRGKRCFLFLLVLICLFAFFPASVGGYKRLSYGETRERRWPLSEDDFECEREYAMKLKQK